MANEKIRSVNFMQHQGRAHEKLIRFCLEIDETELMTLDLVGYDEKEHILLFDNYSIGTTDEPMFACISRTLWSIAQSAHSRNWEDLENIFSPETHKQFVTNLKIEMRDCGIKPY